MQKVLCNHLEIKSKPDDEGCFSGYASIYNIVDSYHDIILPGAFGGELDVTSIKLLWQHEPESPIGVFTKIEETVNGLYVEGRILTSIERGREVHELLKAGAIDGLSIGFQIEDQFFDGEYRYITKLKLWEISIVTFPANEKARIYNVRGASILNNLDRAINSLR
ncbi:MAG: HK97 family phage prohead protease [Candidatus Jidaibacter sp.]|jgi:hypothetical protein|nr:HK97 family phage prohead protease [Candidatus Jidaibacter sp.]